MVNLLKKAAECLANGQNPFRHPRWLMDNRVTPDECVQLAELMGVVLQGFSELSDREQINILRRHTDHSDDLRDIIRVVIDHRGILKGFESANPSRR
jgi:hypothetical protein